MPLEPRQILFLAYPGHQLLDVTGPLQMFAGANDELARPAYELSVAAPRRGAVPSSSGLAIHATRSFAELAEGGPESFEALDTLVTVGGDRPAIARELKRKAIRDLALAAHGRTRRIASVCVGTFFLADAGLLDGRRAATHWDSTDALERFRPAIDVDADAIFVCDPPFYTSAGVTAGIDLALALVEADHGRAVALAIARRHVIFRMRAGGQSQFSSALAAQASPDRRLARLAETIREAPEADWRAETLTRELAVSPRTLNRMFRQELSTTPANFVECVRVDAARSALIDGDRSIEAIAQGCGFGSVRRMDRAFARTLGTPPREFRKRFQPGRADDSPSLVSKVANEEKRR